MPRANEARHTAQHTPIVAALRVLGSRRLRKEAPIAWPAPAFAQVAVQDNKLAIVALRGATDDGDTRQHTRVRNEVPHHDAVCAVEHDVVRLAQLIGIRGRKRRLYGIDVCVGVQQRHGLRYRGCLVHPNTRIRMQDLARKITALDTVIVHYGNVTSCEQRQRTYTSCGKVLHSRASQAPCSHHKHASFFQGALGICPKAGKDQLPTVPSQVVWPQRRRHRWRTNEEALSIDLHVQPATSLAAPTTRPLAVAIMSRWVNIADMETLYPHIWEALTHPYIRQFLKSFFLVQGVYQLFACTLVAGKSDEQQRKRSWIITTFAAFCSSMMSIPFVFDLFWCHLDWRRVTEHRETIADPLTLFFMAYLSCDLVTGVFCYRKFVNLSSGWIHHIVYFLFCMYWIQKGWSHCFAINLCMELPTWIMGIGTLKPRFRSYWAFTTSFLSTRILLHLIIIYSLSVPSGNHVNKEAPSKMPLLFAVLAFPMHVIWAYKSVRGLRRRMKKLAEEAKAREKARLAAIDEATRLLDSADELELGHDDTRLAGAPSTRVTHRSMHAKARAMQLVSNAAYVLWHSAPEAWRQAYREELDFNKKQGIDPKDLRRSALVRRALARHLLHGNKRGHNVPLVKEDDEDDDLEDWMSITSLDSFDHDKPRKGLQVSIGKGIRINMPRELDPILHGQKYVVSEYPVDREASGSRRQRIVGQMRRRFEVARRDMVVF